MKDDADRTRMLREEMVEKQIRRRGVRNPEILDALLSVPRHLFMKGYSPEAAYGDHAMPIGMGQTISQPYMVAIMTQVLVEHAGGRDKVLEIGTGSGYQAAILSLLFGTVISMERVPELAAESSERLRELGYGNVTVKTGDGTLGHPEEAPYDAIMVTAGAPHVPAALKQQLAEGGALVIPVGSRFLQQIEVIRRTRDRLITTSADGCVFVPLIGRDGWKE